MITPDDVVLIEADFSMLKDIVRILRQDNLLAPLKFNEVKEALLEGDDIQVAMTPDGDIIGVIWCTNWEENTRGIESVVVDEDFRNRGIGSMMLASIDPNEVITKNYMSVGADDFAALNFLKKRGYRVTREVTFDDEIRYITQKSFNIPKKMTLRNRLKWKAS